MIIRPVELADAPAWEAMRRDMWPEDPESHAPEIAAFFKGTIPEPQAVFVVQTGPTMVAVMELSIRVDLKELSGKRVGYVEGLYVVPASRGSGIVRSLLRAARNWAQKAGCDSFASDRAERIIVDPTFRPGRS